MQQSLKATKQQAHSPSKVETVLSDNVKLSLATVTGEASKAFGLYVKKQDASIAYDTIESLVTDELYSYLVETMPDYATYQAVKKHIISSIATAKSFKYETIEKWFNGSIVKAVKALGYELPKAESRNAETMAKHRAELASIDDKTLIKQIEALSKSADAESLKRATQLAKEKQKRETQAKNATVKAYKQNVADLKKQIKDKIATFENDLQLAAMLYAVNNVDEIIKLAKIKA